MSRLLYAEVSELPKKENTYQKGLGIISNGEANDYPQRVDRLIANSITAKQSSNLYRKYCTGLGFEPLNDIIVSSKKQITLFELWYDFNKEDAAQGGAAIHVMYKLDGTPDRYEPVPYEHVRKGKKDSEDYSGMYGVHSDWATAKKKDIKWIHAFNPDPQIVQKQIKKAGGKDKYKGQLFFYNPSNMDYPYSPLHPVLNDADSEFRASVFKNKSLRKGFFGKNILITPPTIESHLLSMPESELPEDDRKILRHQKEQASKARETLKGFVGVENHEGFMSLEMEYEGDDIDKAIKHIKIESDIDDKLFEFTEKSVSNNIRKAYNNIPPILLDSSDGSFFGNSGDALQKAKEFYQEQTEEDRKLKLQAFKKLFQNYSGIDTGAFQIKLLVTPQTNAVDTV